MLCYKCTIVIRLINHKLFSWKKDNLGILKKNISRRQSENDGTTTRHKTKDHRCFIHKIEHVENKKLSKTNVNCRNAHTYVPSHLVILIV